MSTQLRDRPYSVHPSSIMMVLILMGITTLFGALSLAYIYTRVDKGMFSISVPWLFLFNTGVLLASSYWMERCRMHFGARNESSTIWFGYLAVFSSILFLGMQAVAWYQLFTSSIKPGTSGGYGYLYAISILHFLHVIAGIPFLLRLLIPLTMARQQGNAALLFIDDHIRRRLRHTAWYWHFIDVVWLYLILFFLVNRLF